MGCSATSADASVAPDTPSIPLLAAVVLSDGEPAEAAATARDAQTLADRVRVVERRPGVSPTEAGAGGTGIEVVEADWQHTDGAAGAIAGLDTRWLVVLAAGERLAATDDTRRELASLPDGPVEIAVGELAEVRLHPATAEALEHIGGQAGHRAATLRIVPAGEAGDSDALDDAVAMTRHLTDDLRGLANLTPHLDPGNGDLERLRERIEGLEERRLLDLARHGRDVCWVEPDGESEPLVTVRIATYDRGELVVQRAIESAMAQTYERLEILVIGDSCDEATERAVQSVRDPRVRFVNLPSRGIYPAERMHRWMVAGTHPMNAGLTLARGAWIAPCDDDDELTPDHVEVLLREAKARRLEMIYSKARCEVTPGVWQEIGRAPLEHGHVSHGSVLYSLGLRFFRHSNTSWKQDEPGDWNLWRRMVEAGVRTGFHDGVTYVHYLEGYKRAEPSDDATPSISAGDGDDGHGHGRPIQLRDAGGAEPDRPETATPPAGLLVQLGCGPNRLDGWLNVDVDPAWNPDVVHDLRLGLPLEPSSAAAIYSEHFFEHLTLEEGVGLLRHCREALRPGGVIRIAMPDLRALVDAYLGDWRDQAWLEEPAYDVIDSPAHMLNFALREWGHRYVYDAPELHRRLAQCGFTGIETVEWGRSRHATLRGLETRPDSRLVVEATAP